VVKTQKRFKTTKKTVQKTFFTSVVDDNFVFHRDSVPSTTCMPHSSTVAAQNSQLHFFCELWPQQPEMNSVD